MKRSEQAKLYLEEAKTKPKENKLYIDDLELSIPMFEAQEQTATVPTIQEGFRT